MFFLTFCKHEKKFTTTLIFIRVTEDPPCQTVTYIDRHNGQWGRGIPSCVKPQQDLLYSMYSRGYSKYVAMFTVGSVKGELLGISFAFVTAALNTSAEQSVQALNGCIPDFQLNALRLTGKFILHGKVVAGAFHRNQW